jgi:hypothetical protein
MRRPPQNRPSWTKAAAFVIVLAAVTMMLVCTPASASQTDVAFHWSRRTIYVNDHTDGRWPVTAAAARWNAGGSVRINVGHWCRSGYPCVHVYARYASGPYVGQTPISAYYSKLTSADITMNSRFAGWSWTRRAGFITHEMGHALGLSHDSWASSVMYACISAGNSRPTSYDLGLVRRGYSGQPW